MPLKHPAFFAVTRRSVVGAIWLGLFLALLPLPGQTIVAVLAAWLCRVNVPITLVAVMLTNPLTMVPIFYFEYQLGLLLLELPSQPFDIELSLRWLREDFITYWRPLLLGSAVTATLVSSTAYVAVSVTWRLVISARYRSRGGARKKT
jgi:uncharacterized protein (DUF2062 family)